MGKEASVPTLVENPAAVAAASAVDEVRAVLFLRGVVVALFLQK